MNEEDKKAKRIALDNFLQWKDLQNDNFPPDLGDYEDNALETAKEQRVDMGITLDYYWKMARGKIPAKM